jgi:hypothetical protein
MLNSTTKYPRNTRYHNTPSLLEDVTWDRYTFKLPGVLTNPATAHPSIKDRFYRATLEGISAAHQASSLTKIIVLSSRFEFPNLIHEIDGSLATLYDNTTGTNNNIEMLQHPHVFTFSRPLLRNEQGQEIAMPNQTPPCCPMQRAETPDSTPSRSPSTPTKPMMVPTTSEMHHRQHLTY